MGLQSGVLFRRVVGPARLGIWVAVEGVEFLAMDLGFTNSRYAVAERTFPVVFFSLFFG